MRVISGKARGVKLQTIKGNATRPTTDRVKESIFSMIQFDIAGSVVLDAFAGSGALGIEALSRGAAYCDFVDASRESVRIIRQNLNNARLDSDEYGVYQGALENFFKKTSTNPVKYDMIFLDPPYGKHMIAPAIDWLIQGDRIAEDALIIIEHDGSETLLPQTDLLSIEKEKKYGQTLIHIYRR